MPVSTVSITSGAATVPFTGLSGDSYELISVTAPPVPLAAAVTRPLPSTVMFALV